MTCTIQWKASVSASALHAAWRQHDGVAAADPHLANLIREPAENLAAAISAALWPVEATLSQLVSQAAEIDNNRRLVAHVGRTLVGPKAEETQAIERIAGAIGDAERALLAGQPGLVDELALRGGPLREQWDARGPGMLRRIAQLTDELLEPAAGEVILVAPWVGGHGVAFVRNNRVVLEAVLFHPHEQAPETLRLGWLLSQLNLDLPKFAEAVSGRHDPNLEALAMIPAALAAGESVELCHLDVATIELALRAWSLGVAQPGETAQVLSQWWETYRRAPKSFPVALAALQAMLA